MRTLLNELSNLKEDYKYAITINGVCSFIPFEKDRINLESLSDKQKMLLDFHLIKEKAGEGSYVLRFVGKTILTEKEILGFLLQVGSYNPEIDFIPQLITVVVFKTFNSEPTLIIADMKNDEAGSIYRTPALATKYNGNYAVIGDYYFTNYDHYQSKLTELSEIWIGDYLSKRKR